MIKHMTKLTGWTAAFAAVAATASAEVKINENLSLDGYAIGAFAVTEGTAAQNDTFLDSGSRLLDSAKVAVNGKYGDFTGKVSLLAVPNLKSSVGTSGLLDAYVTYTAGEIAVTAGKFNSWFGYESFDSPSNAFITYGPAGNGYTANYATGAKVEYITKTLSTGISVRDSLNADTNGFLQGDGEFADDQGYEAYVLYSGIEKLTVFLGYGLENTDNAVSELQTFSAWASYAVNDKLTVVGEYGRNDNGTPTTVTGSYTALANYAVNSKVSVSGRVGFNDSQAGDYSEVGVASTYTINSNFAVKGEISKKDFNSGVGDTFFYAVQGLFKF